MKGLFCVFVSVLAVFAFTSCSEENSRPQTFEATFGGDSSGDICHSVTQTADGGYIMCGQSTIEPEGNKMVGIYVVKTDDSGNLEWETVLEKNLSSIGNAIIQTDDLGYVIAGCSKWGAEYESLDEIMLLKIDSNGTIQWSKRFPTEVNSIAHDVRQTSDGGFIITGISCSKGFALKTSSDGTMEWLKKTTAYYFNSVRQTSDQGYILCGAYYQRSENDGVFGVYLLKLDELGNEEWSRIIGVDDPTRGGNSIEQTSDGGYICGASYGTYYNYDYLVIKVDALGQVEWSRIHGGPESEYIGSIEQTNEGGYILCGTLEVIINDDSFNDIQVIKMDALGREEWIKTYGGPYYEFAANIQQTVDCGYVIGGWTAGIEYDNPDYYLLKTDQDGYL
ncbi:hypothetical protein JXQ70_12255 [bacterium]|nr:hypothetical protein [bacterium]